MAKAPAKKAKAGYTGKRALYELKGTEIVRARKHCPKCGPGIFMAAHKNRSHCGKCGYTEFQRK